VSDRHLEPPTPDRLAGALTTRWLGRRYEWLDACESTSNVAAARAREGAAAGAVVAADAQTAGRGRLGRSWHSPPGENLYFSIVLRPKRSPQEIPVLTLLVGGGVAKALAARGARVRVKWPNDVLIVDDRGQRRKVAGILTEMTTAGDRVEHVVVGVGLNVNTELFPNELADRATSLRRALGETVDRTALVADLLAALEPLFDDFESRGAPAAVEAFSLFAGLPDRCRVAVPGQTGELLEGTALGIDPDGALRVRDETGQVHRILSGELLP
jgi:BirA family transcriptional regulator, biotin operon repressor / biotin---[acetyl-CoA-carboxylase] ligase